MAIDAQAIARNPAVISAIASNLSAAIGVSSAAVRVVNVTDLATLAVFRTGSRLLAGAAPGTLGVSITCTVNLGKGATAASIETVQSLLVSNLNAALSAISKSVAANTGIPLNKLLATAPTADGVRVSGPGASLVAATVVVQTREASGSLAVNAGVGAGVGVGILLLGVALYIARSYKVHGKAPWQRDRAREVFELKAAAAHEAEELFNADTVATVVTNPAATGGKSALTLRVQKAVALEIDALRQHSDKYEAELAAARAEVARLREAVPAVGRDTASAAASSRREGLAFSPVPVGGLSPLQPSSAPSTGRQWVEHVDGTSGRSYWHNLVTKETTWVRPADF
jgi:hypothetical protein